MEYGLICRPEVFLYGDDLVSRTDELLYGWAVEIQGRRGAFLAVETHYGYTGFLPADAVVPVSLPVIREREADGRSRIVIRRFVDVLDRPKVQGQILITLGRGSIVRLTGEQENGYLVTELLDGTKGFLSETAVIARADTDAYFWSRDRENFFLQFAKEQLLHQDETALRNRAVSMAKLYEGSQYRWSGKSAHGTDCSGLTFMSWFLTGILIYRDAMLMKRWPVHEITLEQILPGDLLFFPGHIAMYIGGGRYVHSTGHKASFGYAVNSLDPAEPDYREDLAHGIEHVGSLFD